MLENIKEYDAKKNSFENCWRVSCSYSTYLSDTRAGGSGTYSLPTRNYMVQFFDFLRQKYSALGAPGGHQSGVAKFFFRVTFGKTSIASST